MGVAQAWFGCMRLGFLCTGCVRSSVNGACPWNGLSCYPERGGTDCLTGFALHCRQSARSIYSLFCWTTVLLRSTLQPLSAVGLSRRHLLSAGVPAEAVERLYRMLCAKPSTPSRNRTRLGWCLCSCRSMPEELAPHTSTDTGTCTRSALRRA